MKQNEIIVMYGRDYKAMTRALCRKAGLAGRIPRKDTLIGLKPNLVSQALPSDGATTHPEVAAGVIEYLQANGFTNLVVLEGSWVGDSTMEAAKTIGYDRLLNHYGVPFWDMQKERPVSVDCKGMQLNICKRALDIEFLINLPVLKGHCQTRITCALKNMKGLLPNSEKRRFHRLGLHDPIGHLSAGIHQDFVIVDSICGDMTMEDGGNPIRQDRIFAAADPVLCDVFGCSLIGVKPSEVPYIGTAAALGCGSADLSGAEIHSFHYLPAGTEDAYAADAGENVREPGKESLREPGEESLRELGPDETPWEIDAVRKGFSHVCSLAMNVNAVESCSGCYGCLIPALERLSEEGLLSKLKEPVAIGQGHRGKSGVLGIGSCTRLFRHTLAGCPPLEDEMYAFLKEYIRSHES